MSRYYRSNEDVLQHRTLLKPKHGQTPNNRQMSLWSQLCCGSLGLRRLPLLRYYLFRLSLRQWLLLVIFAALISFLAFNQLMPKDSNNWTRIPPKASYYCHQINPFNVNEAPVPYNIPTDPIDNVKHYGQLRADSKILVFVETQYSKLGRDIVQSLEAIKFKYKIELSGKSVPLLTSQDHGKYSVIIFENMFKYLHMNRWNRDLLDKYCREFGVGIVGFLQNGTTTNQHGKQIKTWTSSKPFGNLPLAITLRDKLKDCQLNPANDVLRITRAGAISLGPISTTGWYTFDVFANKSNFVSVAQALPWDYQANFHPDGYKYSSELEGNKKINNHDYKKHLMTTVLQDKGAFDGIQKVLFGHGLQYWLHGLILLDSLSYLSRGKLSLPLQRYIQIDIDDIFVGERGTRLKVADVDALINFQQQLCDLIPGFKFNLGFSGKFYHRGYPEENDGDDHILKNSEEFHWFSHTYSHSQAHLTNNMTIIENELIFNQQFAESKGIRVDNSYIISPHHSGVYPVHEPLYDAWRKVLNVRVTSTEEYPHLRPAYQRRGFQYKNVLVLPRQTCGLYTHTIYLDRYPGGRARLETSIFGGELFNTLVTQPINVFMTHQSNYANDRLAIYTFHSLFKFVQCWTNLQLLYLPPTQLANKYFEIYPEEKDPIWTNPCEDRRHYNIWSPTKSCHRLPKILILGPQKTGSTALSTFLAAHPSVHSSRPSSVTFEEVQFFNSKNYRNGLDWYMDFFTIPERLLGTLPNETLAADNNSSNSKFSQRIPPPYAAIDNGVNFYDKSATYFDGDNVAGRAHALLPRAKLVILLISPLKRAYSWYQHQRAHNLSVALNFTFYEIVSLDFQKDRGKIHEPTLKAVRDLRNRCLSPGTYATHLEKWLAHYSPDQMMIVDGEELRDNPVLVMNRLQTFLKLETRINYRKLLRFEPKKGFFCLVSTINNDVNNNSSNTLKCLGKSKGRLYEEMDERARKYLHDYYLRHNVVLSKLLTRLRVSIPMWLQTELSTNV